MDDYGRAQPDPTLYPSSTNGAGFGPLAAWAHSLGLKFGIHVSGACTERFASSKPPAYLSYTHKVMHTIPLAAIQSKLPVLNGGGVTADQIAVPSPCPWNDGWYGVNMSHPAGQAYIDSLYALYAQWCVTFAKVNLHHRHQPFALPFL